MAFQDRHENKDAYDLVYWLLNFGDGPGEAGRTAPRSAIADHEQVREALRLLAERFESADHDGPHAYAGFLDDGDPEQVARLRQEAVQVVRQFLAGFRS